MARNVASLGAKCLFVGVIGDDVSGKILRLELGRGKEQRSPRIWWSIAQRPTTRKLRFVSEHFSTHLLRADWEMAQPVDARTEAALIKQALKLLPNAGAVVLSDYAKGVLTPKLIRAVIERAKKLGKPVIVDPKGSDFSSIAAPPSSRRTARSWPRRRGSRSDTGNEIAAAAKALAGTVGSKAVLVTLSEEGMLLYTRATGAVHVPAYLGEGAGRVRRGRHGRRGAGGHAGARAPTSNPRCAPPMPRPPSWSARAAPPPSRPPSCARASCPRRRLPPEEKIVFDWRELDARLAEWRAQDLRIGFTNGVFDLLHPGHIKVLAQARAACDRLVVGLNSDASVKRLKGKDRPIQPEHARAEVLAGLEAVDLVAIFEQDTPLELIEQVRPTVLVKGGDYRPDQVVGPRGGRGAGRRSDRGRSGARASARRASSRSRAAIRVGHRAHANGADIVAVHPTHDEEHALVREFFGGDTSGYFVEVGANHPTEGSQTWHLEQAGWTGVLVEPQPDLAAFLVTSRKARVFAAACSSPDNAGQIAAAACRWPALGARSRSHVARRAGGLCHPRSDAHARQHPGRGGGAACRSICCRSMSRATRPRCCAASTSAAGSRC